MSPDSTYIISADRDEKIRVSCYPHTFETIHFLLGHTQFISSLLVLSPNRLISGGGDNFLILWDYLTGKEISRVGLDCLRGKIGIGCDGEKNGVDGEGKEMKIAVRKLVLFEKQLALIVERCS